MKLTIEIAETHPLYAQVVGLLAGGAAPTAAPKSEPDTAPPAADAPKRKTAAEKKAEADAKAAAEQAAAATDPATPSAGDEAANKAAYEEVKKRIMAGSEKNREATASILRTYGVARGSELTPDQYPAVIEALDELLNEEELEDLS